MPDGQIAPTDMAGRPREIEHTDAVIVGAGLSGIGMACRLVRDCRKTRFVILETRDSIGGTWDLFRYPGVRSDSDMHTLGYGFRPWRDLLSLAPASAILDYVRQTATEYRIDRHIRFRHRVRHASFSSSDARWTLEIETAPGVMTRMTCNMLLMCGGYYSYEEGHAPSFPGSERFQGKLVHPQFWPTDLDYADKRVVVIGSGATAVTLVPAMAKTASHVTMLQRSPTYIVSRPSTDKLGRTLRRFLPHGLAGRLTRAKNIGESLFYFKLARAKPADVKRQMIGLVRKELGREYDVAKHFTPTYNPWDQRVCLVPDADLFKAIRGRKADIVTDKIKTFTETGIELESGEHLPADVIVSATGLKVQPMGGASFAVDGVPVDIGRAMTYKGMMLSDIPNFVFVIGYTNASWTLKSDLVSLYTCRLLNYMRRRHVDIVVAPRDPRVDETPLIDFSSGYVQRASTTLPKQGDRAPWTLHQNYLRDMPALRFAPLKDGTLRFTKARQAETV